MQRPDEEPARQQQWIDRNWHKAAGWAAVAVLGFAVTVWLGSAWGYCYGNQTCDFNPSLFEATGTWVGGLGTFGAVAFAAIAFRAEDRLRRETERERRVAERETRETEQAARERERLDAEHATAAKLEAERIEAGKVYVRAIIGSSVGDQMTEFRVFVVNDTSTTSIHKVTGWMAEFGTLGLEHTLEPGSSMRQSFLMGHMNPIRASIAIPEDKDLWLSEQVEKSEIQFELAGRVWRRRGNGTPELI